MEESYALSTRGLCLGRVRKKNFSFLNFQFFEILSVAFCLGRQPVLSNFWKLLFEHFRAGQSVLDVAF